MKIAAVVCWIVTALLALTFLLSKSMDLFVPYMIAFVLSFFISLAYLISKGVKKNNKKSAVNKAEDNRVFVQNTVNINKESSVIYHNENNAYERELIEFKINDDGSADVTMTQYWAASRGGSNGGQVTTTIPKDYFEENTVDDFALKLSEMFSTKTDKKDFSSVKNNPVVCNHFKENINLILFKGSTENAKTVEGNVVVKNNQPYIIHNGSSKPVDWETVKVMALEQSEATFLWINKINESNWKDYICKKFSRDGKCHYQKIYLFSNHTQKQKDSLYYNELVFDTKTDKLFICHYVANGLTGHGFAGNPDFFENYSEVSLSELCETISAEDKQMMLEAICKSRYAHRILTFFFSRSNAEEQIKLKENWETNVYKTVPNFDRNNFQKNGSEQARFPINLNAKCAYGFGFLPAEHYTGIYIDLPTGQPYYSCYWIAGMGVGPAVANNYKSAYHQHRITWDEFKQCAKKSSDEAYEFFKDINSINWKDYINSDWVNITLYGKEFTRLEDKYEIIFQQNRCEIYKKLQEIISTTWRIKDGYQLYWGEYRIGAEYYSEIYKNEENKWILRDHRFDRRPDPTIETELPDLKDDNVNEWIIKYIIDNHYL